jgi:hypothetical protein
MIRFAGNLNIRQLRTRPALRNAFLPAAGTSLELNQ